MPNKNLSEIEIRDADISGANLRFTNLSKAKFKHAKCCEVDFTGADLESSEVVNCDFIGAIFDKSNIK